MISKKTVSTTDNIILKSPFGQFLKSTDEGLLANSSFVEDSCIFSFKDSQSFPSDFQEV